jgi:hypothetical protein
MARMSAYCVSAIIAASLLLSCAGMHHPPTTVSQEPVFECINVVGAESFDALVRRVVSVAENQAFLTTQSVPSDVFPTSVLPSGHWEMQKAGKDWRFRYSTMSHSNSCNNSACRSLRMLHMLQLLVLQGVRHSQTLETAATYTPYSYLV